MLSMLDEAGLVRRDPRGKSYSPGSRLVRMSRNVLLNPHERARRHTILETLAHRIGETCNLTMLDGTEVLYLDRVEAAWPLRMELAPGSRVPLHCTASGKLFLAMMPTKKRKRLTEYLPFTRYTELTITDRGQLESELNRIRAEGISTDNEEYVAGLICVAVPVFDRRKRCVASIAVHAPVARMSLARALDHTPELKSAAERIALTIDF